MELNYHSIEALLNTARENNCRLSKLVLDQQAEQMEMPREKIYEKMRDNYKVMASCIAPGSAPDLKSTSGLTGGDAYRMKAAVEPGEKPYRSPSWRSSLPCTGCFGVKCVYGTDCGCSYSRKLRYCSGGCPYHAGTVWTDRGRVRDVTFYCIGCGYGDCK